MNFPDFHCLFRRLSGVNEQTEANNTAWSQSAISTSNTQFGPIRKRIILNRTNFVIWTSLLKTRNFSRNSYVYNTANMPNGIGRDITRFTNKNKCTLSHEVFVPAWIPEQTLFLIPTCLLKAIPGNPTVVLYTSDISTDNSIYGQLDE